MSGELTALLQRARESQDNEAREMLYRAVEGELRKIANAVLPAHGAGHTLQATVLIDEAFMRLVMGSANAGADRKEFYRIASGVMRRILVDHARRQRPGRIEDEHLANLPGSDISAPDQRLERAERLLAVDRALEALRQHDAEAADLFEVHYFGGLRLSLGASPEEWIVHVADNKTSLEETAAALGIKRATAYRIMHRAKSFLAEELAGERYLCVLLRGMPTMTPEQLDRAVDDLLEKLLDLPPKQQEAMLHRLRSQQPDVCAAAAAILAARHAPLFPVAKNAPSEVTQILQAIEHGDPQAASRLLPLVYDELRALAARQFAQEKPGQTLQPTALVHEAYLRLVGKDAELKWDSRGHFFAAAAEAMRRILIEHARAKKRLKHGGGRQREQLHPDLAVAPQPNEDVLALDAALLKLAERHPLKARLVELRYFAGLTGDQAAHVLGISTSTVDRDWVYARAWLHRELQGPSEKEN